MYCANTERATRLLWLGSPFLYAELTINFPFCRLLQVPVVGFVRLSKPLRTSVPACQGLSVLPSQNDTHLSMAFNGNYTLSTPLLLMVL